MITLTSTPIPMKGPIRPISFLKASLEARSMFVSGSLVRVGVFVGEGRVGSVLSCFGRSRACARGVLTEPTNGDGLRVGGRRRRTPACRGAAGGEAPRVVAFYGSLQQGERWRGARGVEWARLEIA